MLSLASTLSSLSLIFLLAGTPLVSAQGSTNSTGGMGAMSPACAQAQILAQGIALNIMDQQSELATANAMAAMLKSGAQMNPQQYMMARDNLVQFINNGIAIRQMNQLIMPKNNAATPGLAFVANAQLEELGLATNLTGNPQTDAPIVATLQKDFSGGIQKNMQNQQMAMQGCGAMTAAAGAMPGMPMAE